MTGNAIEIVGQLEECLGRSRVVVWHDPSGEFCELAGSPELRSQLGDVPVLSEADGPVALKCRLNALDLGERAVVYRPAACPDPRGDWLADVELFAEGFSADGTSMLLRSLEARDSREMRAAVERCRSFLGRRGMVEHVRSLARGEGFDEPHDLELALMLAALGATARVEPVEVVAAFLCACVGDEATALGRLERAGIAGRFRDLVAALAGIGMVPGAHLGAQLARRAFEHELGARGAMDLQGDFCLRVLRAWYREASRAALEAERDLEPPSGFEGLSLEELLRQDVYWQAEELIVAALLREVTSDSCDVAFVRETVSARRGAYWYGAFEAYYCVIDLVAQMRAFHDGHRDGFSGGAVELWDAYRGDAFRMDQLYRKLRAAASPCLVSAPWSLDDALRDALAWAERLYKGWYLRELGQAWDDAVEADYRERGFVAGIERATEFYALRAHGLRGRSACATVIVSDALRYEIAEELKDRLEGEGRGTVELCAQLAPFPSITPLGMAALLPHGALRLDDDCNDVRIDGISTAGLERRQKALRSECYQGVGSAVALSSSRFLQMSVAERRELGRASRLVYLYHNVVDSAGESDEDRLPAACDDAVGELVALVRACARSFGPNVIVTADHGFIYTATPLDSLDKVGASEVSGEVTCVTHRRAVLARAGATSDVLLSVSMGPAGRDDLVGFVPHGYLRVSQPGAGDRFVHGGISLQEVCVPVLKYHAASGKAAHGLEASVATVSLLTAYRVVGDWHPVVAFHQDEALGGRVLAGTYRVRFEAAGGRVVSDEVEVRADRAEVGGEAGTIRVRLSIIPGDYAAAEAYDLVLRDAASGEELLRERFSFNLPAVGDAPQW